MRKAEIRKLVGKTVEKGLTLIPLKMYLKNGWLKCELALCKGKKTHDKRDSIAEREQNLEAQRAMRARNSRSQD